MESSEELNVVVRKKYSFDNPTKKKNVWAKQENVTIGSLYFILGNVWDSLVCKWYCDFIHLESPFLLETLGSIYQLNGKPGVYFKVIRARRKWMGWKGNKTGSGAGNC